MKQLKPKNGERKFCSIIRTKQKKGGTMKLHFSKMFLYLDKRQENYRRHFT